MAILNRSIIDRMIDLIGEHQPVTLLDLQCDLHLTLEDAERYIQYLKREGYAHLVDPYADHEVAAMVWAAGRGYKPKKGVEQPTTRICVTTRHWPRRISFQVSDVERCLFPSYGVAS